MSSAANGSLPSDEPAATPTHGELPHGDDPGAASADAERRRDADACGREPAGGDEPAPSEAVRLLQQLVRIPSVSGEEEACRDALAAWLGAHGVTARIHGRNVLAEVTGAPGGRSLLLCSHIDVVPVGAGWTDDPWSGDVVDGVLRGRGSNDAKSSVAAMAVVASRLRRRDFRGRLVLAFVCDEETGGEGIEACVDDLPPCDAVVVGEPTELDVCPGQRGLLKASVVARGRACHASRPWEGDNAIERAARDVLAIQSLSWPEADPLLGPPTLQVTVIHGGERSNVIPGECRLELDGRPTPGCDNDRMVEALEAAVEGEVEVRSRRYVPVLTDASSEIVRVAQAASPTGRVRGFGGVSDLFHLRHIPGVVMGPGTSKASHAPDEWVATAQVDAAVEAYGTIADAFLATTADTSPGSGRASGAESSTTAEPRSTDGAENNP